MVYQLNARKELRRLLTSKEISVVPGVHDFVTAKLIERAGFHVGVASIAPIAEWVIRQDLTSSSLDLGSALLDAFTVNLMLIGKTLPLPVILDARNIFGTSLNLAERVPSLEKWGIAGIVVAAQDAALDDDASCAEEMIRVAIAARSDDNFVVIASIGLDSTVDIIIQRAKAYRSSGADMLLIEGLSSIDQFKTVPEEIVDTPLMIEMGSNARTPVLSASELQSLGYSMVYWPALSFFASTRAVWKAARELMTLGKIEESAGDSIVAGGLS